MDNISDVNLQADELDILVSTWIGSLLLNFTCIMLKMRLQKCFQDSIMFVSVMNNNTLVMH